MKIINKTVERFEDGKMYVFVAETLKSRNAHKWADLVDGQIVTVKQSSLGFITMCRTDRKPKDMPILPKFCYEVEQ